MVAIYSSRAVENRARRTGAIYKQHAISSCKFAELFVGHDPTRGFGSGFVLNFTGQVRSGWAGSGDFETVPGWVGSPQPDPI